MAIYHFSAKVISRVSGSSAVASAAYRAAERLHDDRLGRNHDFSNKAGVVHSDIMLPEGAPERLNDRATLWNEVEAGEKRKDAQLARAPIAPEHPPRQVHWPTASFAITLPPATVTSTLNTRPWYTTRCAAVMPAR